MKNWGANHGKWQNWKEKIAVENGRDAQHIYIMVLSLRIRNIRVLIYYRDKTH